jgi:hypothetical protein
MVGLKEVVVEDEDDFDAIVCAFYDARYGAGWCERRHVNQLNFFVTATATFLSQWYKVSAAHGLARRFYRAQALATAAQASSGASASNSSAVYLPPLAIVRMRPDHFLTVRWNLTRAAFEFSARQAAVARGGNFLALWGPTAHSEACGAVLCPDVRSKGHLQAGAHAHGAAAHGAATPTTQGDSKRCYSNGRLDDGFALGSPAAMDGYAAPYHPYQTKCCEEYVTSTLPLAGLVQVQEGRLKEAYRRGTPPAKVCITKRGNSVIGDNTGERRSVLQPSGVSMGHLSRVLLSKLSPSRLLTHLFSSIQLLFLLILFRGHLFCTLSLIYVFFSFFLSLFGGCFMWGSN